MTLNEKYVLHIPLYKFTEKELILIEIEDILEDLISRLAENGYENLYIVEAEGYYKSRRYTEKLITIFTSTSNQPLPDEIFRDWFNDHNDVMGQEALAFEHNNRLFVEKLELA